MTSSIGAFDRTGEFLACAKSFHQRVLSGRLQLTSRGLSSRLKSHSTQRSSEFLSAARSLVNDLQLTLTKLHKLALMLDEAPESFPSQSISKLIEVIQCDIVDLNKAMAVLHGMQKETSIGSTGGFNQLYKHQKLMVTAIEYRMSYLVNRFRHLLERSKVHLSRSPQKSIDHPVTTKADWNPAQPCRTADPTFVSSNLCTNAAPFTMQQSDSNLQSSSIIPSNSWSTSPANPTRPLYPPPTLNQNPQSVSFFISSSPDMQNTSQPYNHFASQSTVQPQQQQKQLQLPVLDQEVRQRDAAMRRVESTIVQLGEIYQQFSSLVREQGDIVTRIDSQTDEADLNIGSAHEQLTAYLRSVSARRGFMIKVFVTILLCFVVFAWIR